MTRTKLNLPFEYKKLPQYFDALSHHPDTDIKNQIIENILKNHGVKTVLDMTCGTGSQVFFLHQKRYTVTRSDFSSGLLEIARAKAALENIKIHFIDGDMRTLKVGTFDGVITIFNAIGHLTKSGFEKAIRNIHKNLKNKGIYVFDILNLQSMTENAVKDLAMDYTRTVQETTLHVVQSSTLHKETGHLTSYDTLTIRKENQRPKMLKSKFTLQIYTPQELIEILNRNGFDILEQRSFDEIPFVENQSPSILTIAQKRD